jgi:alginate O-acetyltransferase complex protein AlgI
MVFSSVTFLFYFLPIFLFAYFCTPTTRGKNITTLIFSLVFYAWGEPWFVFVLLGATALNTAAAVFIDAREGRTRGWALAVAVTVNLLMLAVFKYAGFLAASLDGLVSPIGLTVPAPDIQLPLGISFFTFHALSYLIDVYRRRFPANRNPVEVALYITLFPQLVAGPIVRYKTVARQLHKRVSTLGRASAGARIFIIGLAQKVLIADQVSHLVEAVFDHTQQPVLGEAWLGLVAYTVQIYFDFAGYSNMAIGIGLILGFTLPRNFRLPYLSQSITEFWRRWHMSLSSWLRDYLYIPLGGNRYGPARTYRNLITVFLLCGLWHGASWNFVLWGIWHGGFLAFERLGLGRLLLILPAMLRWAYTLLAVMGGWVLFRAHDLDSAGRMYKGLVGAFGVGGLSFETHAALQPAVAFWLILGCAFAIIPQRLKRFPVAVAPLRAASDGVWTFALLIFSALWVAAGAYSPFLYFRF